MRNNKLPLLNTDGCYLRCPIHVLHQGALDETLQVQALLKLFPFLLDERQVLFLLPQLNRLLG